jgi:RNA polymerase sigma-70 factor, ECF subfamily
LLGYWIAHRIEEIKRLPMHVPPARIRNRGSAEPDIDPGFLDDVQAYLECPVCSDQVAARLRKAWQCFYQTYDPVIRRFALSCRLPSDEIDECAQEVWTTLVTRLRDFQYQSERGRFQSWLYAVVRNQAVDFLRCRKRHPVKRLSPVVAAGLTAPDADPARQCECASDLKQLLRVVQELRLQVSEKSYLVLQMRWIEERPISEIATALELTAAQVRLRQCRMKQRVVRLLKRHAACAARAPQ